MMKKTLVAMILAVVVSLPSFAQIKFGIKGGFNMTSMSLDNGNLESIVSNKSGFFIGPTIKATLPIAGLGIDIAALYDQRKAKIKSTKEELTQKSIQIPINLRYGLGLGDAATFFVFAGPQFDFNVGNKTDEAVTQNNPGSWLSDNSYSGWSLKKRGVSANVGLGFLILNHLQLSANYNFAISKSGDVYNASEETGGTVKESDIRNNAWQIATAYFF